MSCCRSLSRSPRCFPGSCWGHETEPPKSPSCLQQPLAQLLQPCPAAAWACPPSLLQQYAWSCLDLLQRPQKIGAAPPPLLLQDPVAEACCRASKICCLASSRLPRQARPLQEGAAARCESVAGWWWAATAESGAWTTSEMSSCVQSPGVSCWPHASAQPSLLEWTALQAD